MHPFFFKYDILTEILAWQTYLLDFLWSLLIDWSWRLPLEIPHKDVRFWHNCFCSLFYCSGGLIYPHPSSPRHLWMFLTPFLTFQQTPALYMMIILSHPADQHCAKLWFWFYNLHLEIILLAIILEYFHRDFISHLKISCIDFNCRVAFGEHC